MVLEDKEIIPFFEWLPVGLSLFLVTMLIVIAIGIFIGYLVSSMRYGPGKALSVTFSAVSTAIKELSQISPRRVWAMTTLAFREAIRRKVLVVFALFLVLLLFAGWFLDPTADHPGKLYLSFVLTSTNFLITMLAVFLSTFSLPNDVKNRTIYTVVTKPVRAWEIVLGRIIGFAGIGTLLLATMGLFSYFFVVRGLDHSHSSAELQDVEAEVRGEIVTVKEGETSLDNRHRHEVQVSQDGIVVSANHDHSHGAVVSDDGTISFGESEGNLQARVPKYGRLRYIDRNGEEGRGVSVGSEWGYRRYIEGGTPATAIWTFEGLKPTDFTDGIPVEMVIRVFRTYKGVIDQGIRGSIQVVQAVDQEEGQPPLPVDQRNRYKKINFVAQDQSVDRLTIPFKAEGTTSTGTNREMLLFEDLVSEDGKLEIWLQCAERQQYYGVAQADVYIRQADAMFSANFVKGFLGIWFQMIIVTSFAVMFSTFLNGSVAMLATVGAIVLGYFANFVRDMFNQQVEGGGPSESLVRMIRQQNMILEMEPGVTRTFVKSFDFVTTMVMAGICSLLPDYGGFNNADFVANGFDIHNALIMRDFIVTLAYVGVLTTVGYFFLKTREIAA